MVRLNCHSAFKHYEMFHHSYGDVINIGSNNTTIFNMGTGFGGGSFWSGLGYGLGNGIGSIFGGLFGGGMGGFGNYGGYGMSPFGMGGFSPFGNMGTWWNSMSTGGGARSGKSADSDCTCHCKHDKASNDKSCNDPDQKKLEELGAKVNKLETNKDAKPDDAKKLLDDLNTAKEASKTEGHHNDSDPVKFQNWIDNLTNHIKEKGWQSILDPKAAKPEEPEKDTSAENKANVKEAAKPDAADAARANDFDANLKAAGDDKAKLLDLLSKTTDPAQRAKIKAKYAAKLGYTTYDGKEKINEDNMKLVRDMGLGEKADISEYAGIQQKAGSHPEWIKMATTFSSEPVQYNFVGIEDGEYIYQSQSGEKQKYALYKIDNQDEKDKEKKNEFVLIQFEYHGREYGYNIPDQTARK